MPEFNRILVPLDGSALAEKALSVATTLAEKFESTLILLRVLEIPTASAPASHPEVTIDWVMAARQQALQDAESYLNDRQAEIHRQGLRVRALLRDTSPAEDILNMAVAEKVDLIVISSHGEGGLARWTFGSVADKVARHSPCPVLLIRVPAENANKG
jgi:nucleotide-binding universal stress UspA family protein